ncbi:MAG: hypothetical protein NQU46_07840 [Methanolinea sp.]|nr:hypothetical protein [Methanolinea sp.]
MEPESSLLERVRVKEIELKAQIDAASRKADAMIEEARARADEIIREARQKGEADAARYTGEQERLLAGEVQEMQKRSRHEREQLASTAGQRVGQAVSEVINLVLAKDG